MSAPATRPILFSGSMVRAILEGRKTQTRRVFKIRGPMGNLCQITSPDEEIVRFEDGSFHYLSTSAMSGPYPCPYGIPSDLLWVRESWRVSERWDRTAPRDLPPSRGKGLTIMFAAGGSRAHDDTGEFVNDDSYPETLPDWAGKLRPAIHMPRWASRITLQINRVRVERLQKIAEVDAIAEGIEPVIDSRGNTWKSYEVIHEGPHKGKPHPHAIAPNLSPIVSYRELWESINGSGSWAVNPWVWCIEFERVIDAKLAA